MLHLSKKRTMVVARYDEPLLWLPKMDSAIDVCIYNKGDTHLERWVTKNAIVQNFENMGNDVHSFAHHIVENYDRLKGLLIFLQGYPDAHDPCCTYNVNRLTGDEQFGCLGYWVGPISISKPWCKSIYSKYWKELGFKQPLPAHLMMLPIGGMWYVQASLIKKRPKEFYEKLRDIAILDQPWCKFVPVHTRPVQFGGFHETILFLIYGGVDYKVWVEDCQRQIEMRRI